MKFKKAFKAMQKGKFVKRRAWDNQTDYYWKMESESIIVHYDNGNEECFTSLRINPFMIETICANDWYICFDNKESNYTNKKSKNKDNTKNNQKKDTFWEDLGKELQEDEKIKDKLKNEYDKNIKKEDKIRKQEEPSNKIPDERIEIIQEFNDNINEFNKKFEEVEDLINSIIGNIF